MLMTQSDVKKPENLFLILINIFLKKSINFPIITTGCILDGISPKKISIASENNNDIIININILFIIIF